MILTSGSFLLYQETRMDYAVLVGTIFVLVISYYVIYYVQIVISVYSKLLHVFFQDLYRNPLPLHIL